MMLTTRVAVPVPAAGVSAEVRVAGHLIYVESTDLDSTPEGAPTIHFTKEGSDGFPAYPKLEVTVCEGFKHFWIRGTALSAGGTLRLLVVLDPCADLLNVRPNPCGGSTATVAPGTEPFAAFVSDNVSDNIKVTPLASVSWATFLDSDPETVDIRDMWADYVNRYLYWCTGSDSGTQVSGVYRAAYDPTTGAISGSVETLVAGSTSIDIRGLAVDVDEERIYISNFTSNRISWIPIAGGSATLLAGTYSNPNRLRLYKDPSTTLGVLDIALDGVGEIMRYDIDSETDLGTLTDTGPAGTNDYDEVDVFGEAGLMIYRRDANTVVRLNDYASCSNEVSLVTTASSSFQILFNRANGRVYFTVGGSHEIHSIDPAGLGEVVEAALPTASVTRYPRFALG